MNLYQNKLSRPRERSKNSNLQYVLEELKFIKTFRDFNILLMDMMYLLTRKLGTIAQFTKVPPSLQIEPTNICNARCICCHTWTSPRPKGYMDYLLFEKIIDDAAQIGVRRIRLFLHIESGF